MSIELSDGAMTEIVVHAGDNPERLATEFCEEHDLDDSFIEVLTGQI
ncbi:MAG: hypothetical protein V2I33_19980 [Kangiellaceae bacterium]|jgi:hypothetical protein|nr:hypothetical protein [Kangiellaceae bacterium]